MQIPELSGPAMLIGLGVAGVVVGALITAVISYIIGSGKMSQIAAAEQAKQQVMDGLDRSCAGIESLVSSVNMTNINLVQFKKDVAKRISTLEKRAGQFAEHVDPYFNAYVALRIQGYREIISKIEDFGSAVGRFGGTDLTAVVPDDSENFESDAAAAPAPQVMPAYTAPAAPVAPVHAAPAYAPPPTAVPPEPEAAIAFAPEMVPQSSSEVDIGATMMFDNAGQPNIPAVEEAVPDIDPGAAMQPQYYEPVAPAGMPPMTAPGSKPPRQQDDDEMYGATMQFSMNDINAARDGMQEVATQEPNGPEPTAEGGLQFDMPMQGNVVDDEAGETFVIAPDDEQFSASPVQPKAVQQPVMPPPAQQQKPVAAQQKQSGSSEGGLITGNDLLDQMDAFFNFGD